MCLSSRANPSSTDSHAFYWRVFLILVRWVILLHLDILFYRVIRCGQARETITRAKLSCMVICAQGAPAVAQTVAKLRILTVLLRPPMQRLVFSVKYITNGARSWNLLILFSHIEAGSIDTTGCAQLFNLYYLVLVSWSELNTRELLLFQVGSIVEVL